MKKFTVLIAGAALIMAVWPVSASHALSIIAPDNIAANTYMAAGSTLNGEFNINSAIPSGGQYNLPYSISNATATFQFTDDLQDLTISTPVVGEYSKLYKLNNDQWWSRITTQWSINESEQVQLNIVGQLSTDGTTWYEIPLANSGTPNLDSSTNNETPRNPAWDYYYTQLQTGEHGYSGTVTLTEALGAAGLNDLSLDGIVPFTLSMLQGDMIYQSGNLFAELNANPNFATDLFGTDVQSSPVPEPGTIMLLGIGLLGFAVFGNRRKKKTV